jgi:myo-inositol-hexaphosphate 3-phosphohydrolase
MTLPIQRWCLCIVVVSVMGLSQVSTAQTAHSKVSTRSIGNPDGVAICVNLKDPARSTVIGAAPQKGIGNFDLKGTGSNEMEPESDIGEKRNLDKQHPEVIEELLNCK